MSGGDDHGRRAEAQRQQRWMAALAAARPDTGVLGVREEGARAWRGLQAYRANAQASAVRALAAAYPTVQLLLGEENFAQLARELWRDAPPERGDLGEWGAALPAWVDSHEQLGEWPYLADCARLDWALHLVERAADAELDAASFARLGDTDPARLQLRFMPGVALAVSGWPIAVIHAAHQGSFDARDDPRLDAVREAIAERRGECVVVSRRGWKGVVTPVEAELARWMRGLIEGDTLGAALARAGDGVDFAAWLETALQHGWLQGVAVVPD